MSVVPKIIADLEGPAEMTVLKARRTVRSSPISLERAARSQRALVLVGSKL